MQHRLRTRVRRGFTAAVGGAALIAASVVGAPQAGATASSVSWTHTVNYKPGGFRINGPDGTWLVFQSDGNLVSYFPGGFGPVVQWNSATNGLGARLSLQSDGNVVIYTSVGVPVFQANYGIASGRGPYTIRIVNLFGWVPQERDRNGQPIWSP